MRITKKSQAAIRHAVKILGGGTVAAEMLGVNKSTVSLWCSGNRRPSPACAILLAKASGGKVNAVDIRPDLAAMDTGR